MKYNLSLINERIIDNIEEFLAALEITEYNQIDNRIMLPCPVHGGDNTDGASILLEGVGNWKCFTHFCHEEYTSSMVSFVRGVMSRRQGEDCRLYDAIKWAAEFTGVGGEETEEFITNPHKTLYRQLFKNMIQEKEGIKQFVPKNHIIKNLAIPSSYFVERGYDPKILTEYMVGECVNNKHPMYGRAVVPCVGDDGEFIVGQMGRMTEPICKQCGFHHNRHDRCPQSKIEQGKLAKWRNNKGFEGELYLYNYWRALEHIQRTRTAILVEGCGSVWRLEELGIHISLALLGVKFTPYQKMLLERSGALNLIILTDADDAGKKARDRIATECKRMFNIYSIDFPAKDLDHLPAEEVLSKLNPLIERVSY